jgi:hypothetical protein
MYVSYSMLGRPLSPRRVWIRMTPFAPRLP